MDGLQSLMIHFLKKYMQKSKTHLQHYFIHSYYNNGLYVNCDADSKYQIMLNTSTHIVLSFHKVWFFKSLPLVETKFITSEQETNKRKCSMKIKVSHFVIFTKCTLLYIRITKTVKQEQLNLLKT